MSFHKSCLFPLLLIFSLLLAACGQTSPEPDPTATPTPPNQGAPIATLQPGEPTWTPTPIPFNPTPTLNYETPNPVQISELQFLQQENRLVVIAKFQNILEDAILRDVQFEVLGLDAAGNRIAQEFGGITYLFPRQTTGLVRSFDLIAGVETTSVEVHFTGGTPDQKLKYQQPFTITNPTFFGEDKTATLTGWLENRDDLTYTEIELNAIAYNANGEIIGGGNANAEFVPPEDRIGVSVPVAITEVPARVEIYPWISSYSASLEGGSWWNNIKIEDWNFILTADHQVAGGAILTNITDRILTGSYYIITVSDEQDQVCLVEKNFINYFLPGEAQYFSPGVLTAPASSSPTHVDLIVIPGEFGEYDLAYNPLVTSQSILLTDQATPTVRVTVLNNLNASISTVLVTTLLLDAQGTIIGGGQTYSGALPANSSLDVDVPVAVMGDLENLTINSSATLPQSATIGQ
ncbi:MAG: FxLYD domain-containing protein [Anaerolineaceae bacterium]